MTSGPHPAAPRVLRKESNEAAEMAMKLLPRMAKMVFEAIDGEPGKFPPEWKSDWHAAQHIFSVRDASGYFYKVIVAARRAWDLKDFSNPTMKELQSEAIKAAKGVQP